jgi:hypothetical protein
LEPALSQHLFECEHCRITLRERKHFDERIRGQLRVAPLPRDLAHLQTTVLQAMAEQGLASSSNAANAACRPISRRRYGIAIAVSLMIAASWLTWESFRLPKIPYTTVVTTLVSRFIDDPRDDVARLVSFDGNFPLWHAFPRFHHLRLSEAHGVDLDGDNRQDAAIFNFAIERRRGILAVIPTRRMPGVPLGRTCVLVAGQQILQWQSDDGKLTHLCFLQQGSMQGLVDDLFSERRG